MKTVNFLRFYLSQKSVILITSTEHRPLNRTTCERLTMKNIKYAAAAIALTALPSPLPPNRLPPLRLKA